jgi:hypothetical protein
MKVEILYKMETLYCQSRYITQSGDTTDIAETE